MPIKKKRVVIFHLCRTMNLSFYIFLLFCMLFYGHCSQLIFFTNLQQYFFPWHVCTLQKYCKWTLCPNRKHFYNTITCSTSHKWATELICITVMVLQHTADSHCIIQLKFPMFRETNKDTPCIFLQLWWYTMFQHPYTTTDYTLLKKCAHKMLLISSKMCIF